MTALVRDRANDKTTDGGEEYGEGRFEAEDGIVEIPLVAPELSFPWMTLPPGPRRWAPSDLSVEVVDGQLDSVCMTYRTVGDRVIVVAGCRAGVDVDWMAERIATSLLFAHYRTHQASLPPSTIMAALNSSPTWVEESVDGWTVGTAGVGERPVRLAVMTAPRGVILTAMHGMSEEEARATLATLQRFEAGGKAEAELHERHRRALAQRWWDAPRTPWTPDY